MYFWEEIRSVMAINFQALEHANLARHVFPYSIRMQGEVKNVPLLRYVTDSF